MNIKLLLFFNVFFNFSVKCQKWIDVSETIKLDEKIYSRKTGDLFSGIMTEENNSGIIISRYSVVNGELNGPVFKFYENGDTLLKGNYKFGNLDGDIFSYYSPSAAWLENIGFEITKVPYCESKATYINGVRSGKSIYYFENGLIWYIQNYLLDYPNGEIVIFKKNGDILAKGQVKTEFEDVYPYSNWEIYLTKTPLVVSFQDYGSNCKNPKIITCVKNYQENFESIKGMNFYDILFSEIK